MGKLYQKINGEAKPVSGTSSGANVSWHQITTAAGNTRIAEITIDGTTTNVYAPTGSGGGTTYVAGDGIAILDDEISASIDGTTVVFDEYDKISVPSAHTHSNKSLLDTYSQTNSDITDAVNKKHSHDNYSLLSSYTQSNTDLADAVSKKHSHNNNLTELNKIGENSSGKLTYDGQEVGGGSNVSWQQNTLSGTKIATITIEGTSTDVYAPTGGGGGTTDYSALTSKPQINSVELAGNKTSSQLGLASETHSHSISDVTNLSTTLNGKVDKDGSKILSDNNYSNDDKAIVDGVTAALAGKASTSSVNISNYDSVLTIDNSDVVAINSSGTNKKITWSAIKTILGNVFASLSHTHTKSQITDFPTLSAVATSNSYNDLDDKPSAVTESTVSGWGFTKNTGTYSKPLNGIPSSDMTSAVQSSLALADSSIQAADIENKVDKVTGYGLSKNDYSDAEKAKVANAIQNPSSEGTSGQVLTTDGEGGRSWEDAPQGGHTMVEQGLDKGITNLEAIADATDNKVVNAYTVRAYANSFKYKFISTINAGHNSIGTPIEDKTTWSSATETAAGWMFSGVQEQAVRDLLIGLDLNESANLDWRFDPVATKTGLSVVRWQFDTTTGMMCFVFNQNVEVATDFCVDLELLRKWDDLV